MPTRAPSPIACWRKSPSLPAPVRIAPLVIAALILDQRAVAIQDHCDDALSRVVRYAVGDLAAGGRTSQMLTGEAQNLFDGSDAVEEFQLAWIEAYLQMADTGDHDRLDAMAHYSKLGGNQTTL